MITRRSELASWFWQSVCRACRSFPDGRDWRHSAARSFIRPSSAARPTTPAKRCSSSAAATLELRSPAVSPSMRMLQFQFGRRLTSCPEACWACRCRPSGLPRASFRLPGSMAPRLVTAALHWRSQQLWVAAPNAGVSVKFARSEVTPTLYPRFAKDVRIGRVKVVGAVLSFDGDHVLLEAHPGVTGKTKVSLIPDVVVAATGFRAGLADIVSVPGRQLPPEWPRSTGQAIDLPNLHLIGQTNPLSGQLNEIRIEAGRIARAIRDELASNSGRQGLSRWKTCSGGSLCRSAVAPFVRGPSNLAAS